MILFSVYIVGDIIFRLLINDFLFPVIFAFPLTFPLEAILLHLLFELPFQTFFLRKNLIMISLEDCRWPNGKKVFFFYLRFLSMFVFMSVSLFSLSGSDSTIIYPPFPFSSGFSLGSLTKPRLYLPEDEV